MHSRRASILVAVFIATLGCSQKHEEKSNGPVSTGNSETVLMSFEEAFSTGRINWQPVKNVELTTTTAGVRTTESFEFVTKLKYDDFDNASVDTTGQKQYTWPNREATFGPEAVIRITQNVNVREGALQAGDEWTWTGQQWTAIPK